MSNTYEQMEVFSLAQFFYSRIGPGGIVLIINKPELLISQFPKDIKLFVVCDRIQLAGCPRKFGSTLPNASFITLGDLGKNFLEDKVLVRLDYLDNHKLIPSFYKYSLGRLASQAAISITATGRPARKIGKRFFGQLANQNQLIGRTKRFPSHVDKDVTLRLDGRLVDIGRHNFPALSVLAIMHVYNERDIIVATISHLLDQGVDVHIIDNWSTDGTYAIVQALAAESDRITYERFPEKNNSKFELEKMLTRVTDVAKLKKQYDWILLNDADEIRWSPWKGVTLQQAFSFIDSVGYNSIDYTVFNFIPTKEGFSEKANPLSFFKYGEFSGIPGHFVQVKSWKNCDEAVLAPSGGHHISFPNLRVFPLKFLLGHYPIRSTKHALEKIFKDRQPRYAAPERKKGWHTHYDKADQASSFIRNSRGLIAFNQDSFYEEYLLERISGLDIKIDQT